MAWTEIMPDEGQECGEEIAMLCEKLDCIIKHLECITKTLHDKEAEREKEVIVGYHERHGNG